MHVLRLNRNLGLYLVTVILDLSLNHWETFPSSWATSGSYKLVAVTLLCACFLPDPCCCFCANVLFFVESKPTCIRCSHCLGFKELGVAVCQFAPSPIWDPLLDWLSWTLVSVGTNSFDRWNLCTVRIYMSCIQCCFLLWEDLTWNMMSVSCPCESTDRT